jgi:hypothetical protein
MAKGYSTMRSARNAAVVNYSAQTFYYNGAGLKHPIDYATFWTTAAAFGIVAADAAWDAGGAALAVFAAGPALDRLFLAGDITNAEVVLTASVISDNQILYQNTETFYVNPSDLPLYWSQFPEQQIATQTVSLPLETRRIRLRAN